MTFQISSEIKTTVADSSTCHVSTNGDQRVKSSRKGRGLGPHPASAHQHLACKRVSLSTAYLVIPITSSLTPVISISPAPQQWSVSHTTAYERLTVMDREGMQYTQHLQPSALHLPSLSTSALPLSSVSMCPCAYESVFYLHYPCLLLATETKYFKAERASLPTGLLLLTLPPAQKRGWWEILADTLNQSLCPSLPRPREGGMASSKLAIAGIPLFLPGPCTDEL